MKDLKIDDATYDEIGKLIGSEASPVGIDAKKTHIIIIEKLRQIEERLIRLEAKIDK